MERRGWPWKKKSSEKIIAATDLVVAASVSSSANKTDQDNSKNGKYVQVSAESFARMSELEEQVKILNDKLASSQLEITAAQSEVTTVRSEVISKENLVNQHAKVAEEAVSGWEKAEAEALSLKQHLESVTLLKLSAEERASHLDGALKECMRQIRSIKDESEQKLQDVIFTKTKQWDKIKFDLDAKVANLEQELLKISAENNALTRSLQERSHMLMKISEEKSQADAEIEILKSTIQACEKEISSFKYELHVVSKELEIRNEEKNMCVRSAEVANKQHSEGMKKVAKLEAECQRLRGLVRKKLPGPAALAQMKLEVETLGREYGETRPRRSPTKNTGQYLSPSANEVSFDNAQLCHKDNEFLAARLLAMEEETKMLKEALSKRNSELQASRSFCAKTVSKLRNLEAEILVLNRQKSPVRSNSTIVAEDLLSRNSPSTISISEDDIEEQGSITEPWATSLMSDLSNYKKEKTTENSNKVGNNLELMDDFLEMEKLAHLSTEANGTPDFSSDLGTDKGIENSELDTSLHDAKKVEKFNLELQSDVSSTVNVFCSNEDLSTAESECDKNHILFKLKSELTSIFESQGEAMDLGKILEDINHMVQEIQDGHSPQLERHISEKNHFSDSHRNRNQSPQEISDSNIPLVHDNIKRCIDMKFTIDEQMSNAISQIYKSVLSLGRSATENHDKLLGTDVLSQKFEEFSSSVNKVLCGEMNIFNFINVLSLILADVSLLCLGVVSDKGSEGFSYSPDCIDKVTLLESNVIQHDPSERNLIPQEVNLGSFDRAKDQLYKFSVDRFEHLKIEKDNLSMDLSRCTENLEQKQLQLMEAEESLTDLKLQLAFSQKSNTLAETQLKCMTESYKSLELHVQELENELNILQTKVKSLEEELQEEKHNHEEALVKCMNLEEQIKRMEACLIPSQFSECADVNTKQETEIAAAAEKLAECQETIFLLSKQLKALRPLSAEFTGSTILHDERIGANVYLNHGGINESNCLDQSLENVRSCIRRVEEGSSFDACSGSQGPFIDYESNLNSNSPVHNSKGTKHRSSASSSSSSSFISSTPEKPSRFSRFFSRGKDAH